MKNAFKILAVAAIAICFAFAIPAKERKVFTVVIDAAHGGKDFGAVHEGIMEKDVVRQVVNKITTLNSNKDIVFHVVNGSDDFLDLTERVKAINSLKADLVISLHVNAERSGNDASGMEFFVGESAEKSKELADMLSAKFREQNFEAVVKPAKMMIITKSEAPSMIFEMGYLTNDNDRAYLTSENGQQAIAAVIVDFINEIK